MANIVELRGMSDARLRELLENAREEMFNLRFQKATAQLDNHARVKHVRREIAQLETVLRMRQLAVETAAAEPAVAAALARKEWQANAHFDYEESAWQVNFVEQGGTELASAWVNLNRKRQRSRRERTAKPVPQVVVRYEVVE